MTPKLNLVGLTPREAFELLKSLPNDNERAEVINYYDIALASLDIMVLSGRMTGTVKPIRRSIKWTPALLCLRRRIAEWQDSIRPSDDNPIVRVKGPWIDIIEAPLPRPEADIIDFEAVRSRLRDDIEPSDAE